MESTGNLRDPAPLKPIVLRVAAVRWMTSVVLAMFTCLNCAARPGPAARAVPSDPAVAAPSSAEAWDAFWRSRGVSPAPPRDFLDLPAGPQPELLNLTDGAITDETAARWVNADLRRLGGDSWAARHLRLDIASADVLGPPGLNGTDESIKKEQAMGTIERTSRSPPTIVMAAVIAVSGYLLKEFPAVGLTNFVIVLVYRATGEGGERVFSDGRRESIPARRPAGQLSWQLDTGEFRENPVVGPLWYQARGWSCQPDGNRVTDSICGLVRPRRSLQSPGDVGS